MWQKKRVLREEKERTNLGGRVENIHRFIKTTMILKGLFICLNTLSLAFILFYFILLFYKKEFYFTLLLNQ